MLDTAIIAESPDDVLVRFQLAMAHHNFGVILTKQGRTEAAIEAFRKAQEINQALVKEFPNTPSYASNLATNFDSLALALDAAGQPGADQNFRDATTIYEWLIAAIRPISITQSGKPIVCVTKVSHSRRPDGLTTLRLFTAKL